MTYSTVTAARITLLATHCACCGRALRDATSVEFGVGPVCRKKYLYEDALPVLPETLKSLGKVVRGAVDSSISETVWTHLVKDDSRSAANLLVKFIAVHQKDVKSIPAIRVLNMMGYTELADRIEKRIACAIEVLVQETTVTIKSPYDKGFVTLVKGITGRKYNPETKCWSVPSSEKGALWGAMLKSFPGSLGKGPKGPFVIEVLS